MHVIHDFVSLSQVLELEEQHGAALQEVTNAYSAEKLQLCDQQQLQLQVRVTFKCMMPGDTCVCHGRWADAQWLCPKRKARPQGSQLLKAAVFFYEASYKVWSLDGGKFLCNVSQGHDSCTELHLL